MNLRRVRALFYKEWIETMSNRMLVSVMVSMPVLMASLILGTASLFSFIPEEELLGEKLGELPIQTAMGLSPQQSLLILLNEQYMFYLLMVPIILPMAISCYSIIGEKESRSLEPLLATPLTTLELLTAKMLIAVVPSTVLSWACYLITIAGMFLLSDPVVTSVLLRPTWALGLVLLAPILSVIATLMGIAASSRMSDVRAAQGFSSIIILPMIGLSMVVLLGNFWIELWHILLTSFLALLCAIGGIWLAKVAFQREAILTRWK